MPRPIPRINEPLFQIGDRVEKYRPSPTRFSNMRVKTVFTVASFTSYDLGGGAFVYYDERGQGAWEEELLPRKLVDSA
jgi:hypothetical protein